MNLQLLNIRTQAVQDFLWNHTTPSDFRHDYTRLDAIKEIERQVRDGDCQLWGDMDVGFMFRATMRNPKVIEPHIMGNGRYLRSAIAQGVPISWSLGFEKIVIWTQLESVVRIAEGCGFERVAAMPRMHMGADGQLLPLFVVQLEKPDALLS